MEIMNCSVQVQPQNNYVLYLPCSLFGLVILFYFILFYFYFPFCWQPVEVEQWWKSNDGGDRERETERERERNVKRERERERESQIFGFRDRFRI